MDELVGPLREALAPTGEKLGKTLDFICGFNLYIFKDRYRQMLF